MTSGVQKSYFEVQYLFALQFQYIVTLANCYKAGIFLGGLQAFFTVATHTHAHTQPFYDSAFCPGQPGWAGTRRNIHPLTPIVVINRPLSTSSI